MAPQSSARTSIDRLADQLLGGGEGPFAAELAAWLRSSARFRTFAQANLPKIRKKLRGARDSDSQLDVRAELLIARLLLADQRIELVMEPYGSGKRGPDFGVAFRGKQRFNLEVTRARRTPSMESVARLLLVKLPQLPPGVANALVVVVEADDAGAVDVTAAAALLRMRADRKDEEFFATHRFESTRTFYDRFLRLGAVFVLSQGAAGDARATLWTNRSARIPIVERAAVSVLMLLRHAAVS